MRVWHSLALLCACVAVYHGQGAVSNPEPIDGVPSRRAEWAELRGPVSTCGIKRYPGIRSFTRHTARQYPKDKLKVIQRVSEPFIEFYRTQTPEELKQRYGAAPSGGFPPAMTRELLARHTLSAETSEEELVALLARNGITLAGEEPPALEGADESECDEAIVGADGVVTR